MHFKGLDLNLLVVLNVLLEEKNTTRAGERLRLSQPAVSGALARLREYFNDELLTPVGRQLALTPLAQSLIEPVSEILRRIETTIGARSRFDPATATRQFTVMASDYAMTVLMLEVLRRAAAQAPGVSFALRQTVNSWQEELTRGAVDIVLIPDVFASTQHGQTPLFQEDFTCVVWAENSLVGETLSLEQYLSLGHVGVAFGPTLNPSIEHQLLTQFGYRRRLEVISPTFALLPQLLIGTNRIATMHTRLARLAAQSFPLRLLPLPVKLPPMTEVMQWPSHHSEEPGSQWLRGLLQETAARL